MKKLIFLFALLSISISGFSQAAGTTIWPPFQSSNSLFPADNTYRPYVRQYINTPDNTGLDTVGIIANINALDVIVSPSDSIKDTLVYVVPAYVQYPERTATNQNSSTLVYYNNQIAPLYSTLTVIAVANNYTQADNNKYHKIKFRNKYTSAFIFAVAAADSTVSLSSKQKLYMTFKCIDGIHWYETGKVIK